MKSIRKLFVVSVSAALAFMSAAAVAAESMVDPNAIPLSPATVSVWEGARGIGSTAGDAPADAYGTLRGSTWIAANKFTLPATAGSPPLTYATFHYYNSPGSATPTGYFASIDSEVPNGSVMDKVSCLFEDSSATNDVSFSVQKYFSDFSGVPARGGSTLASFTSTGSPGLGFVNIAVPPETVIRLPSATLANNYQLRADISADTSFAGCFVFWTRQISPGPASASFTDVPTGHQFFKEIEALKASGITLGCSATTYCPDQTVTRGQMAAFLARALGLNFPN
jgi:S-layer homology domain